MEVLWSWMGRDGTLEWLPTCRTGCLCARFRWQAYLACGLDLLWGLAWWWCNRAIALVAAASSSILAVMCRRLVCFARGRLGGSFGGSSGVLLAGGGSSGVLGLAVAVGNVVVLVLLGPAVFGDPCGGSWRFALGCWPLHGPHVGTVWLGFLRHCVMMSRLIGI